MLKDQVVPRPPLPHLVYVTISRIQAIHLLDRHKKLSFHSANYVGTRVHAYSSRVRIFVGSRVLCRREMPRSCCATLTPTLKNATASCQEKPVEIQGNHCSQSAAVNDLSQGPI